MLNYQRVICIYIYVYRARWTCLDCRKAHPLHLTGDALRAHSQQGTREGGEGQNWRVQTSKPWKLFFSLIEFNHRKMGKWTLKLGVPHQNCGSWASSKLAASVRNSRSIAMGSIILGDHLSTRSPRSTVVRCQASWQEEVPKRFLNSSRLESLPSGSWWLMYVCTWWKIEVLFFPVEFTKVGKSLKGQ